eukprot:TRINITY_DN22960_c0_g1_i1.p1 TRINITY_DN22960_c0_g1~~TRINITY_DN22960_c0_g1_i1.p1  ORF type:complete len:163 (-),score=31.26 TRINITY_DN22960_c0_g1_i1:261-749(-)
MAAADGWAWNGCEQRWMQWRWLSDEEQHLQGDAAAEWSRKRLLESDWWLLMVYDKCRRSWRRTTRYERERIRRERVREVEAMKKMRTKSGSTSVSASRNAAAEESVAAEKLWLQVCCSSMCGAGSDYDKANVDEGDYKEQEDPANKESRDEEEGDCDKDIAV